MQSCGLISRDEPPYLGEQRPAVIFIPKTLTNQCLRGAGLPQAEDKKSLLLGQGKISQILNGHK